MSNDKPITNIPILARGPSGIMKVNQQTGTFTDVTIWTPPTGKTVRLYGGLLSTTLGTSITLKFGTGGGAKTIHTYNLTANDNQSFTFATPIEAAVNQVVAWSGGILTNVANVTLFGEEV